jgi:Ran GTPase-activating protein (RanGAP) involved in mRNA processing and transport
MSGYVKWLGETLLVNGEYKAASKLYSKYPSVTELDLGVNEYWDEFYQTLAKFLKINKTVTILNLGYRKELKHNDKIVIMLLDALKSNHTLKVIYLSGNFLGNEFIKVAAELHKINKNIQISI